ANQCRLANGTNAGGVGADRLLANRDFAEASVDLAAFGISPCFTNVIFTSRSSHPLEGADVQDVGGANFPLCGTKSGTKFKDVNGDGVRDADGVDNVAGNSDDESGLSGWSIKLYNDTN